MAFSVGVESLNLRLRSKQAATKVELHQPYRWGEEWNRGQITGWWSARGICRWPVCGRLFSDRKRGFFSRCL